MSEAPSILPTALSSAPVVRTQMSIQFDALSGLRAGHFGRFWSEVLNTKDWDSLPDPDLLPKHREPFSGMTLPLDEPIEGDLSPIRAEFINRQLGRWVSLQPTHLTCTWGRPDHDRPSFAEAVNDFATLVGRLSETVKGWGLQDLKPNLWELSYLNVIPPESGLWQTPADWHRVLPTLFPQMPPVSDLPWSSFSGEWFFPMPEEAGRVRVKVQKSVNAATNRVVLLLIISSRGEIPSVAVPDWEVGLSLGHDFALRTFKALTSDEARRHWGQSS